LRDLTPGKRDDDIGRDARGAANNGSRAVIIFNRRTNERVLRVDGNDRILQLLRNNPLPMPTTDANYRHHATPPQHQGGGDALKSKGRAVPLVIGNGKFGTSEKPRLWAEKLMAHGLGAHQSLTTSCQNQSLEDLFR
jgi:hypothetical protein